jgi:hypothetical protein
MLVGPLPLPAVLRWFSKFSKPGRAVDQSGLGMNPGQFASLFPLELRAGASCVGPLIMYCMKCRLLLL